MKEWTTPDSRNTPSTTNLDEEEIVDAPGNDGNASISEQVKRPNPWKKKMMVKFEKLVHLVGFIIRIRVIIFLSGFHANYFSTQTFMILHLQRMFFDYVTVTTFDEYESQILLLVTLLLSQVTSQLQVRTILSAPCPQDVPSVLSLEVT